MVNIFSSTLMKEAERSSETPINSTRWRQALEVGNLHTDQKLFSYHYRQKKMTCGFFIYKVYELWNKDNQRISSRYTLNSAGILSANMYTLSIYSNGSTWKCYSCQDSFPVQSSNPTPHCLVPPQIRRGDLFQLSSTTYTLGAWVRIPLESSIYACDLSVCIVLCE
jgi:hypothetical protein